jgi:hypothetical protein
MEAGDRRTISQKWELEISSGQRAKTTGPMKGTSRMWGKGFGLALAPERQRRPSKFESVISRKIVVGWGNDGSGHDVFKLELSPMDMMTMHRCNFVTGAQSTCQATEYVTA